MGFFLFKAQYAFLHKVALVCYMTAGTTIKVKDMYTSLASLESCQGGNKSARSYKQEFEVSFCAPVFIVS